MTLRLSALKESSKIRIAFRPKGNAQKSITWGNALCLYVTILKT